VEVLIGLFDAPSLFIALIVLILANIALVIVLFYRISNLRERQIILNKMFTSESLEDVMANILGQQEIINETVDKLKGSIIKISEQQKKCFDKTHIVRYSASDDSQAKLSYSIGITNSNKDGFVITGLHYRQGVNLYVKEFHEGITDTPLSKEEVEAVKRRED
jgi:hypothetical protein